MTDKKSGKIKKNEDLEILIKEIKKISAINNDRKNVIIKGLLSGLFTTLGATFGFAIFLFILGLFSEWIGGIPFLSDIYNDSSVKKIIDYQLQQINDEEDNKDNSESNDEIMFTSDKDNQ